MTYTRYPFDYFLIYLLSTFHEVKHILREVGTHFPNVLEPSPEMDAGMAFGRSFERMKERRVLAIKEHIACLRSRYPVIVFKNDDEYDRRGITSAVKQSKDVVNAFKILGGPERRAVEMCILAGVFPADTRRIVEKKHALDIEEGALLEYQHYFFNVPLLLRSDALSYFALFAPVEERAYGDVYNVGKEAICLHLDIDSNDFDPKVNLRSVYRLAHTQLMRFRDQPVEAGRMAVHWNRILMDTHDRLKGGDDFVKQMLKVMTLFSAGEEEQAFAELDSATGEILH